MSHTGDLRIIKTKRAIKAAFFELMNQKSFDKITIADITDKAMINRSTFYFHFKDKYDLLDQIENEVIENIEEFISLLTKDSLEQANKQHQPLPHIIPLLTYIEENPDFFILVSKSDDGLQFYKKVAERDFQRIMQLLNIKPSESWKQEYRKLLSISIMSSILNQWIQRGMKEPKEELAEWITQLMIANLSTL